MRLLPLQDSGHGALATWKVRASSAEGDGDSLPGLFSLEYKRHHLHDEALFQMLPHASH
jgi:hypothetical protein